MLLTRLAFGYLILTGLAVGIWASLFPTNFYTSFPGFGLSWVALDGPFNMHLVRDAGAAYLMIAGIALIGLLRPTALAPWAVGVTTLCFNLPHLAYHATHLGMYGPLDRVLNVAALSAAACCSAWLIAPAAQTGPRS